MSEQRPVLFEHFFRTHGILRLRAAPPSPSRRSAQDDRDFDAMALDLDREIANVAHLCLLAAETPRTVRAMNPPELPPAPQKEVGGLLRFPTPWQRKTMWTALAAVSVAATIALVVGLKPAQQLLVFGLIFTFDSPAQR